MLPLALGPNRQQDHAARQQDELDEKNGRRQRKRRVQCPQGQGILGEEAPVPQPQRFRQGERQTDGRNQHPDIEQPGPEHSQQPAAAQCEHQRRDQCDQRGKYQAAPAIPAEIDPIEAGGF